MTITAIYTRVSTDDQASNGYGLDVQRAKCEAMATVKGWQVAAVYTDEGISGTLDASERPGLAAMLQAAEKGEINAVIVAALDRLGRKTRIVLDLVEQLAAAGVQVVSCKEALDTSTPTGAFVLTMFAALAQLERDTIVERTTAGRNARGKVDGEKGGRMPLGYVRTVDVTISIDEAGAAIVRQIFALRGEGVSLRAIAERLNQDKAQTGKGGGQWYASSVREVLQNEDAYRGGYRGESSERWPAIL